MSPDPYDGRSSFSPRMLFVVVGVLFLTLLGSCKRKEHLGTTILLTVMKIGYKGYLVECKTPTPETTEIRDLTKILLGENERNIRFVELHASFLDREGYPVDEWKTRLRLKPIAGEPGHFEFRSAGKDRTFDTDDDVYVRSSDDVGNF